jgi:hypothetical protein
LEVSNRVIAIAKPFVVLARVFWHVNAMRDEHAHSLRGEAPPLLPTGDDYRDLAGKIREVAGRTRLPVARRELLRLAANYDRRGDHLDRRSYLFYPEKPSVGSICNRRTTVPQNLSASVTWRK